VPIWRTGGRATGDGCSPLTPFRTIARWAARRWIRPDDRRFCHHALALHENGDAEVIYASGRKASPVQATVGIVSADGTAVLAAGPDFDFPNVGYGGDDDQSIRFKRVAKK
jgi:hypothetical protein